MLITITINSEEDQYQGNDLISLEAFPDSALETLKDMIQAETRIPTQSQHIYHNGQLLSDNSKSLEQLSIADGDMMSLHVREVGTTGIAQRGSRNAQQASQRSSQEAQAGDTDPELIRLQLLGNPAMRQNVQGTHPGLIAALDNPQRFAAAYRQMVQQSRNQQMARAQEIARLNEDPFDIEAQMKIAEIIRAEQVQENLQSAMENTPEVFGRVHMLYIDVEVNGHKVKAFVDSGAQATIMSPSCAEACNIIRLIDKRWAGIAKGVGTAKIMGRVHSAQIKIGTLHLPCSFTVMEGKDVDLLLGLDMLKRHQALIDLSRDKLVLQGVEVPFLGESDIPKELEQAMADEPVVKGPGGSTVGAKTGAISTQAGSSSAASSSAAPAPQAAVQPPPAVAARPQTTFSPESIAQLVQLGFSEDEAKRALEACDGNVEYAAGLLFQS